jgi:hypothetical protein
MRLGENNRRIVDWQVMDRGSRRDLTEYLAYYTVACESAATAPQTMNSVSPCADTDADETMPMSIPVIDMCDSSLWDLGFE